MAPNVCRKTNQDLILEATPKKIFMIFAGETLKAEVAEQLFGEVWENSGKNPLKICLLLHLWCDDIRASRHHSGKEVSG